MAITATIAVSDATVQTGQPVTVTCTVANSGGSDVILTGLQPTCTIDSNTSQAVAVALGQPPIGGAFDVTVPASGELDVSWEARGLAPVGQTGFAQPDELVYSMGAVVYTNDGSVTEATPTTVTVSDPF